MFSLFLLLAVTWKEAIGTEKEEDCVKERRGDCLMQCMSNEFTCSVGCKHTDWECGEDCVKRGNKCMDDCDAQDFQEKCTTNAQSTASHSPHDT